MNVAGFLRWALTKPVIIALVIVAGIAGGAIGWKSTTSHFESTAAVLVIPPGAGSTNAKDNPFTDLGYGAAQVAQAVERGADGAAGIKDIIDQDDRGIIDASVWDGGRLQGAVREIAQIVPVQRDVERAPWNGDPGKLVYFLREALR